MNKEPTIKLINETLSETLDAFEMELLTLECQKREIPDEMDTLGSIRPFAEFTLTAAKCAQFIESIRVLTEDAVKMACIHLKDNELDEFKKDKEELLETNRIYERYRCLYSVYDKLISL